MNPHVEFYSSRDKEEPFNSDHEAKIAGEDKRRTFMISAAYYEVKVVPLEENKIVTWNEGPVVSDEQYD